MKVLANLFFIGSMMLPGMHKGFSQNNSSPYSILGIGDIEESYFNRTSGMANTGIAYRNKNYLIHNNPASNAALQEQAFTVDLAARGKFVSYYSDNLISTNNQTKDFGIGRFGMGIKVSKWWGSSVGLMPFSRANYSFSGYKSMQGTNASIPADYQGTGGVNQFYWDNGFSIGKHFSVGVTSAFLIGTITQTETLAGTDATDVLVTADSVFLRNFYFKYGVQYYTSLSKKWDISLGATYANKRNLAAEYSTDVSTSTGSVHNEVTKNDYFKLPDDVGLGIALTKNKQFTIVADYRYQNWSELQYRGTGYSLQNSNRVSIGFEYSKMKEIWPYKIERVFYQGGLFYSDSYLQVKDQQLKDMGISVGIGMNSKRSTLSYSLGFEYGIRGTRQSNLIQERYSKITFSISYKDIWYTKGIKYN